MYVILAQMFQRAFKDLQYVKKLHAVDMKKSEIKRNRGARQGMEEIQKSNLHPGVEALGYVNSTTPDLLASTSFLRVVFVPSFVSTSPPNPSKLMVLPAASGARSEEEPE